MGVHRRIADIQPFAELARGPTTVVYKGYQRALDRFVLLKVLRGAVGHDEALARRFEEEARLIARVQHPNVVAVYAFGREDGQPYLAAEFVEGVDLRRLLEAGALPVELAAFVLLEAARGLHAAHACGVLHRDLKPANLLLAHEGRVKLTDFGMASLVEDDAAPEVRGTPGYLVPEQVRGAPPAPAADLFSLGATFFEMLAGRPAFAGAETGALLDAVLHHDPLPDLQRFADVPEALRQICARLLARDPAARYADAGTLVADLEAVRDACGFTAGAAALRAYLEDPDAYRRAAQKTPGAAAPPERYPASPRRPARRRRVRYALGLALAVLLAGAVAGGVLLQGGAQRAAPPPAPEALDVPRQQVADAAPPTAPPQTEPEAAVAAERAQTVRQDKPEAAPPALQDLPEPTPAPAQADSGAAVAAEPGGTGTLLVDAQPWADVFVDGDSVGRTPLRQPLPAAAYRVTLKNPLFPTHTRRVEIGAGEDRPVNVSLWSLVGRFSLQVSPWADVLVDGAFWDTVPPQRHPLILRPGPHTLRLRHPALGTWDTTFTVRAGEERLLRFNLNALLRPR